MSYEEENEFWQDLIFVQKQSFINLFACLMLYSGIRISEALGLTWDDINMEEKTININHQMLCRNLNGKLVQYCEDNTKTSNGSRIII